MPYFKGTPNSIVLYKKIFLHVIHVRIIVPWLHFLWALIHITASLAISELSSEKNMYFITQGQGDSMGKLGTSNYDGNIYSCKSSNL